MCRAAAVLAHSASKEAAAQKKRPARSVAYCSLPQELASMPTCSAGVPILGAVAGTSVTWPLASRLSPGPRQGVHVEKVGLRHLC